MAEGQKGRKIGRNAKWCQNYRLRQQGERNKAKKLLRHFKRYGYANASAVHCYNNLPMLVKPAGLLTVTLTPSKAKQKEKEHGG